MSGGIHVLPDGVIVEQPLVVSQADVDDVRIRPIRAEVGERQINRPNQWENIKSEQEQDRWPDKQPGHRPVGQASHASNLRRLGCFLTDAASRAFGSGDCFCVHDVVVCVLVASHS